MYIRRKVFSVLDTGAGERLFFTTDYIFEQYHPDKYEFKQYHPDKYEASRKTKAKIRKVRRDSAKLWEDVEKHRRDEEKFLEDLKKMGEDTPKPEAAVSNSKPVIKTESKLSKLAKNKYAKGAAGLLVLGGTAAGGYYLLNKKNKKDKEDKE